MIGFRSELLNDTKGTAVLESQFFEYQEHRGIMKKNNKGALISTAEGVCTAYGLKSLEKFGQLFIQPGSKVYPGQVIGENMKESEVELNPTKKKELNNIRTKAHEEKVILQPHKSFSIEEAICYIRGKSMNWQVRKLKNLIYCLVVFVTKMMKSLRSLPMKSELERKNSIQMSEQSLKETEKRFDSHTYKLFIIFIFVNFLLNVIL